MSFLTPWALTLAALVAVPFALHLLRDETRQRVAFPALRYLRRAQRRSARALRLRDRLLMLVRAALLLVLAAAAAAPVTGRGDAADHWPTDVVMVVDNTASMNRLADSVTLLDAQLERARRVLDAAIAEDRFWILPAVGDLVVAGAGEAEARPGLDRILPTDAGANLVTRVGEAVRLLPPDPDRRREIQVLSDFQATGMADSLAALPQGTSLVMSRVGAGTTNGAITRIDALPPSPGSGGNLTAHLELFGDDGTDTVEVRLLLDGETAAISHAPRRGSVAFRYPALSTGEHAAAIEIPPSGLRADDRRSFVLRSVDPPVVSHAGPEGSYVARALAALDAAGRLALGSGGRAVVIEGLADPAREQADDGVARVLAPPLEALDLARFNARLSALGVPWSLEAQRAAGEIGLTASGGPAGVDGTAIRIMYRLRRRATGPDTVLLRTADGLPWAVAGRAHPGRYVLLASPIDPAATDLPVRAAMVPFMEVLLFEWAGLGGAAPSPVRAGETVRLPADADSIAAPGGPVVRVDGDAPHVPLRAGIHTVYGRSGTSLLAVVTPAVESDPAEIAKERAARRFGMVDARTATHDREWRDAMYVARRGASVVPLLLLVAILLAVTEALLAAPGERTVHREEASAGGAIP